MHKTIEYIKENKSTITLAVLTLIVGISYVAGSNAYADFKKNRSIRTEASIGSSQQKPFSSIPTGSVVSNAPAPTQTPPSATSAATKSKTFNNQLCADAYAASIAVNIPRLDISSKASVDAYNQANQNAFQVWLNAKARLGCPYDLTAPKTVVYQGSTTTPTVTPAPVVSLPCDEAAKSNADTAYAQVLSQEDQRFTTEVNLYAQAHGITGSALVQVSELFMPLHQRNYTSLRSTYFSYLATIHCSS